MKRKKRKKMILRFSSILYIICVVIEFSFFAQDQVYAPRQVAITIDDLPYTGETYSLKLAMKNANKIIHALELYKVPASGFVTGRNIMVKGEVDDRLNLLRKWRDSGTRLENHSFSHLSLENSSLKNYLDDLVYGQLFPEILMRERGDSVRFFRSPYNQLGSNEAKKLALLDFLSKRGVSLAPFTIEHADYVFNSLYVNAISLKNEELVVQIGQTYLAQLDSAFQYAEFLSKETFGRQIPQIFLIHANRINADYLKNILEQLQKRDYKFISLSDAIHDTAYKTADGYVGKWGISWLHRWRIGLGLPNLQRLEPDPPAWILNSYQILNK
jgi:peptidoglycan/xylan/chitin deacetylase (PgdA/CDA1 family)